VRYRRHARLFAAAAMPAAAATVHRFGVTVNVSTATHHQPLEWPESLCTSRNLPGEVTACQLL